MNAVGIFRRLAQPLLDRIHGMVARGVVKLVNDATLAQELQVSVLAGEVLEGAEHLQPYGLSAHPVPGAEVVVLAVGGNRAHPIVILAEDRRHRPTGLAEGEVVVYDQTGSRITLKADGSIELAPSGGTVSVTGDLEVSGNVTAGGDVSDVLNTLAQLRLDYNAHTHKENGRGGGITDPPLPPSM